MKNSFILYTDLGPSILELKDTEAGRLMKAVYRYVLTGEVTSLRGCEKICLDIIRNHLDRDQAKYAEACLKRAEAGRKGGLSSGKRRREANAEQCFASEADNENENDNDNKNENDNDNGNENENGNENGNENAHGGGSVNAAAAASVTGGMNAPGGEKAPSLPTLQEKFPNIPLTKETYCSLLIQYPRDYERRIRQLSDYLCSKGMVCDKPKDVPELLELLALQEEGQRRSRGRPTAELSLPRPVIL